MHVTIIASSNFELLKRCIVFLGQYSELLSLNIVISESALLASQDMQYDMQNNFFYACFNRTFFKERLFQLPSLSVIQAKDGELPDILKELDVNKQKLLICPEDFVYDGTSLEVFPDEFQSQILNQMNNIDFSEELFLQILKFASQTEWLNIAEIFEHLYDLLKEWSKLPSSEWENAWYGLSGHKYRCFQAMKLWQQGLMAQHREWIRQIILSIFTSQETPVNAYLILLMFKKVCRGMPDVLPDWFHKALNHYSSINAQHLEVLAPITDFTVTVVLTTFNRLEMLKRAVYSVQKQSYQQWKLLIGDDCSTDGTQNYCENVSQNDSRIEYIRNHQNLGFVKNYESLMDRVHTDLVIALPDDDWWEPNHLERMVGFFKFHPWISMSCSGFYAYNAEENTITGQNGPYYQQDCIPDNQVELQRLGLICSAGPGMLLRKSLLRELASQDPIASKENGQYALWDTFLLAKMLSQFDVGFISELSVFFTVGSSSTINKRSIENYSEMLFYITDLCQSYEQLYGNNTYPTKIIDRFLLMTLNHIMLDIRNAFVVLNDPDALIALLDSKKWVWKEYITCRNKFSLKNNNQCSLLVNIDNPYHYQNAL